ncbi:hypothetical protein EJB05_38404, partial [Eragrostis curvula]
MEKGSASAACHGGVRIVSRRTVRPSTSEHGEMTKAKMTETETVHLTPWDLQMLTVDYIQMGVLLPSWPTAEHQQLDSVVDHLAHALARALARFYPFAGRLAQSVDEGEGVVTVSLLCTGEGAEFVHAVADDTTVSDVMGSPRIPRVGSNESLLVTQSLCRINPPDPLIPCTPENLFGWAGIEEGIL